MQYNHITDNFAAAPQPTLDEISQLRDLGFQSLMINRPQGEEDGQPTHEQEIEAAKAAGLSIGIVALAPGPIPAETVNQFRKAYEQLPKPIFAHCKGGHRSAILWALSRKGEMSADELVQKAANAGFDVSKLHGALLTRPTGQRAAEGGAAPEGDSSENSEGEAQDGDAA